MRLLAGHAFLRTHHALSQRHLVQSKTSGLRSLPPALLRTSGESSTCSANILAHLIGSFPGALCLRLRKACPSRGSSDTWSKNISFPKTVLCCDSSTFPVRCQGSDRAADPVLVGSAVQMSRVRNVTRRHFHHSITKHTECELISTEVLGGLA